MDHPRWGLIQGVAASRDIKAGEELFAYYGYQGPRFPHDFPWYFELKTKVEKERRLKEEMINLNKKREKKKLKSDAS